ncbi:MAG TPA: NUDIX hydrolase [Vitreimonas sp.]|uniref:NUDIX hydrolase n=1 Tax=Vitreimonas sp. TaxID=3069702 RepID=UPI002D39AF09|nr:NUDIX hydrolase [Vitreimonas sp.]HYD88550.1 NUDIX hydrolase [Vitreimonas sp.]
MSDIWEEDGDPWTVKSVARAFENDWLLLETYAVIHPGGAPGAYTVVRPRRVAVGVLPIEANGDVHLVGQWRFPLARYSWEMPEGGADPGEAPLECARRELEEETGLTAGSFALVLEMDMSNSLTDERAVIYLATDLKTGKAQPEATEVLRHRRAHFMDVLARVADGRIRDSMTVAAVLRAHHMAVAGELPAGLAEAMLRPPQGE